VLSFEATYLIVGRNNNNNNNKSKYTKYIQNMIKDTGCDGLAENQSQSGILCYLLVTV